YQPHSGVAERAQCGFAGARSVPSRQAWFSPLRHGARRSSIAPGTWPAVAGGRLMSDSRFDIIIQGAGMAGLMLARALAPLGLKLAVVDATPVQRWSGGDWELRVIAVTVTSERILRNLDVWNDMARI